MMSALPSLYHSSINFLGNPHKQSWLHLRNEAYNSLYFCMHLHQQIQYLSKHHVLFLSKAPCSFAWILSLPSTISICIMIFHLPQHNVFSSQLTVTGFLIILVTWGNPSASQAPSATIHLNFDSSTNNTSPGMTVSFRRQLNELTSGLK